MTARAGHAPIDFRRLAERLKAVSDPTRAHVLLLLGEGERSVGALQAEIACGMANLSQHLARLRMAGLVEFRRDGHRVVYSLTDAGRELWRVVAGAAALPEAGPG